MRGQPGVVINDRMNTESRADLRIFIFALSKRGGANVSYDGFSKDNKSLDLGGSLSFP